MPPPMRCLLRWRTACGTVACTEIGGITGWMARWRCDLSSFCAPRGQWNWRGIRSGATTRTWPCSRPQIRVAAGVGGLPLESRRCSRLWNVTRVPIQNNSAAITSPWERPRRRGSDRRHSTRPTRTLLVISPRTETGVELMRHRLRVVRGRAILECLARAGEPWAREALRQAAPHAMALPACRCAALCPGIQRFRVTSRVLQPVAPGHAHTQQNKRIFAAPLRRGFFGTGGFIACSRPCPCMAFANWQRMKANPPALCGIHPGSSPGSAKPPAGGNPEARCMMDTKRVSGVQVGKLRHGRSASAR